MAGLMKKLMAGFVLTSALNAQAQKPVEKETDPVKDKTEETRSPIVTNERGEKTIHLDDLGAFLSGSKETKTPAQESSTSTGSRTTTLQEAFSGEGFTLESVNVDTRARAGGVRVGNGETNVSVRGTRNGTRTVEVQKEGGGRTRVEVDKNGRVNVNSNTITKPNEQDNPRIKNVKIDTQNQSGRVTVGNDQNEQVIRVSPSQQSVEIGKNGRGVTVTRDSKGKVGVSGNLNSKALERLFGGRGK